MNLPAAEYVVLGKSNWEVNMSGSTLTLRLVGATATVLLASACGSTTTSTPGAPASPASASTGAVLGVRTTSLGPVLVDAKGLTVYLLTADTPGQSSCSATCLQYWPLVPAAGTSVPTVKGVSAPLAEVKASNGAAMVSAGGWPLYTFVKDKGRCHGPGRQDLWWDLVCRVAVRDGCDHQGGGRRGRVQRHEHVSRHPGRLRLLS